MIVSLKMLYGKLSKETKKSRNIISSHIFKQHPVVNNCQASLSFYREDVYKIYKQFFETWQFLSA